MRDKTRNDEDLGRWLGLQTPLRLCDAGGAPRKTKAEHLVGYSCLIKCKKRSDYPAFQRLRFNRSFSAARAHESWLSRTAEQKAGKRTEERGGGLPLFCCGLDHSDWLHLGSSLPLLPPSVSLRMRLHSLAAFCLSAASLAIQPQGALSVRLVPLAVGGEEGQAARSPPWNAAGLPPSEQDASFLQFPCVKCGRHGSNPDTVAEGGRGQEGALLRSEGTASGAAEQAGAKKKKRSLLRRLWDGIRRKGGKPRSARSGGPTGRVNPAFGTEEGEITRAPLPDPKRGPRGASAPANFHAETHHSPHPHAGGSEPPPPIPFRVVLIHDPPKNTPKGLESDDEEEGGD
ncbi:hypothetical protein Efla_005271 [Eimeria flavescens]